LAWRIRAQFVLYPSYPKVPELERIRRVFGAPKDVKELFVNARIEPELGDGLPLASQVKQRR
jgi:hypothetical protein